MPYPPHLLNDGEDLAIDTRPHWWYFSRHVVFGTILIALLVVWVLLSGNLQKAVGWVWAVAALLWLVWFVWSFLQWRFTYFVVTSNRVLYRTGVVARHGTEIPLERINNINYHQGIWERVIGAGDLDIESAGRDGQTHFENVRHPDGVQQEIYRQMESNAKKSAGWIGTAIHGNGPPGPPGPAGPTVAEQISQLAGLRDAGHITPEEFEAKKAELLGRM